MSCRGHQFSFLLLLKKCESKCTVAVIKKMRALDYSYDTQCPSVVKDKKWHSADTQTNGGVHNPSTKKLNCKMKRRKAENISNFGEALRCEVPRGHERASRAV